MANDAVTINSALSSAIAPLGGVAVESLTDQLARLTAQLQQWQPTAVSSAAQVQSGGSVGSDIGHALLDVFTSGLGLSPVISGLTSLFTGGGDTSAPRPLIRLALPASINASAGVSESDPGAAFGVDRAQGGLPRPTTSSAPTQITVQVQVQALDSRSFLDHSGDIAAAVRQAMLESNVLNDVIREA